MPFGIIFTKADKPKGNDLKRNVGAFLAELQEEWAELPPHFITSSENKRGREEFLNYIGEVNEAIKQG